MSLGTLTFCIQRNNLEAKLTVIKQTLVNIHRLKNFDQIEPPDVAYSWSIVARVEVKFPVRAIRQIQHFIIMDTTVSTC